MSKEHVWALAYTYRSLAASRPAYAAARDIIFEDEFTLEASVYRCLVAGVPQVVVVGVGELRPAVRQRLQQACQPTSEAFIDDVTELNSEELLLAFLMRHDAQRSLGSKVERHAGVPTRIEPH